jgi:hypothetical protein
MRSREQVVNGDNQKIVVHKLATRRKRSVTAHIMEAVSPALNYSDDVLDSALVCSAEEVYAEFQQCLRESGTLRWSNTSRIAGVKQCARADA